MESMKEESEPVINKQPEEEIRRLIKTSREEVSPFKLTLT